MTRRFTGPPPAQPQTQLMAIGDWSTMVTTAGAGYSHWRGLAVSRWKEDSVRDASGNFVLLHDVTNGVLWSATWQPVACTAPLPSRYAVAFAETGARFERHDGFISSVLEVVPAGHGDGEVRRIELHNAGDGERVIDVISWVPLVLGSASADATHPAYSKMFVQTGREEDGGILLAWRRKHDPGAPSIFAAHLCTTQDQAVRNIGFETDRMRFIGRGRSLCNPAALDTETPPPGRVGSVLDPVFSLRRRVTLAPGATASLAFWTLAADSRAGVLERARLPRARRRAAGLRGLRRNHREAPPAGTAGRSRHRRVPAPRRSAALQRPHAARGGKADRAGSRRPTNIVAPWNLRRSAHCRGAHQPD